MRHLYLLPLFSLLVACSPPDRNERSLIASEMEASLNAVLDNWYPRSIDRDSGGFYSTFTYDFQLQGPQDKMIVTQARQVWTNAKASLSHPNERRFKEGAAHGFQFLRDKMWDPLNGGFYTLVSRSGKHKEGDLVKTAYGNAFGIYALAAYYDATRDTAALNLAKEAFMWLENHSHDPVEKGYFQHLTMDGTPIRRDSTAASTAETGYKDQNSSIHLLEAFTELYRVWPDALVRERLQELLLLIRDTITTEKGYLTLFLEPDWTPVSFRDSTEEVILKHHNLDHVSFGHDVETAYLMLEASETLGLENDERTETIAKRMVDHALANGWDDSVGGFYDEGYYFKDKPGLTIIRDTKNWWAQAEGLNSLLLMSEKYPADDHRYFEHFVKLWDYVNTYLVDHDHGDWYAGGLDKEPDQKTALKGHIWKATYHHYRGMTNCIDRLQE
ncbi:MAG: AGE family epimerase/isomerase [Lewinellaceae bacterium]|nr:AGE family epimerase/isomerase [Lewinella sp.]MCB9282419.1 AGE family epimerase/isomerase [Lewinellaceae bacterium]